MPEKFHLSSADYGVFGFLLVVSASIGLFFSIFGRKQKTNNDYLLAGKDMAVFPTSLSLMATFISVSTIIGIPAEMYLFGTNMTFINLGFVLGPIIASTFFLPIYFKTGVSTPYEYLVKRFGQTTRRILSVIFLLQSVLYSSVSLYAPALALSAVTNLSMWVSVISIAAVGIFYSTLGGMKAVIWTDMYQAVLMYTCLICVIVKGCLDLGGIQAIFERAYEGERILFPTFKIDFSTRYTIWSIFLQGLIISSYNFIGNQMQVQRLLSLKNLKRSVTSSLLSMPMIVAFQLLCCLCGIIFYVYFQTCDPVTSPNHTIESYDQLLPYYIISAMNEYPGLPGLCITGIFSVSLSTISASMNSMAAVTYQDIIRPVWTDLKKDVLITKILNVFFGVLSICATLLVASLGNIVQASILVLGMVGGVALAVFLLASFTTTANGMGVNIGVVTGFLLSGVLTFTSKDKYYPTLPLQNNCSEDAIEISNISVATDNIFWHNISSNSLESTRSTPVLHDKFPMSFMWISPLSLVVCLIIGYIASWIISCIRGARKMSCNFKSSRKTTGKYEKPLPARPTGPGSVEDVPTELLNPFRQLFYVKKSLHSKYCSETDVPVYTISRSKTNSL